MENQTFNASDFWQFLLNNHLIPSGKESYIVQWVRLFFQKEQNWSAYPRTQQLDFFIKYLREQNSLKDWQLRQVEMDSLYQSKPLGISEDYVDSLSPSGSTILFCDFTNIPLKSSIMR